MIHLNDLKTEGGEIHFIVGCFDNSGYSNFKNIEQTTADENSNHCAAGAFDGSTGSGNDGTTGSGTDGSTGSGIDGSLFSGN